ncbi:MAG: ABC transporter permease [Lentisphaerae bacterium]|jgi:putative ABC transport system permease protein|nr:ABC transporter permease [Lentisphaerota bacterium]
MTLVMGAFTIGLILSLLTIGVWLAFRVLRFTDITVDGSLTLGAAVAAVLLVRGAPPWAATLAGAAAGGVAGFTTGMLHTRFKIQELLSGILVMTALYSVNLRVMGRSNVSLLSTKSIADPANRLLTAWAGGDSLLLFGWRVPVSEAAMLLTVLAVMAAIGLLLRVFLVTHFGTALRAAGDNAQMIRAQGVDNRHMQVFGLCCANALVGLAGALLAQYQGFADVQMGIGMIVWGLASVIIGEALVSRVTPGLALAGAVMGTILFRLLIAIALRWGLNPNDLKLVTALFVFAALVLPGQAKAWCARARRLADNRKGRGAP